MTKWGTTHGTIKACVLTFLGFRKCSGAGRVVCPWHPLRWLPRTSVRFYPHYLCCWAGGVPPRPPAPPRRLLSFVLWGRCPHCHLPVRYPCVGRALSGGAAPRRTPRPRSARGSAVFFMVGWGRCPRWRSVSRYRLLRYAAGAPRNISLRSFAVARWKSAFLLPSGLYIFPNLALLCLRCWAAICRATSLSTATMSVSKNFPLLSW